jgi:hypothetical protein
LEARAEASRAALVELEEVRRERVLSEALARLSDADLRAVGELVDAALSEAGGGFAGGTVDLWKFASDSRDRAALCALQNALAAAQMDKEQAKLTRGARRHG